jgi:hypothetical protein
MHPIRGSFSTGLVRKDRNSPTTAPKLLARNIPISPQQRSKVDS